MNYESYFKDLIESTPDYRKIVFLLFLFQNDEDLLKECGFLKNDVNSLKKEFKNILMEENEEDLDYIENEKESTIEKVLNK